MNRIPNVTLSRTLCATALFALAGIGLVGCDSFPYVIVENDTDAAVIVTAADYARDTQTIAPHASADMAPLSKKQDAVYKISRQSGDVVGCVTAKFQSKKRTAKVSVSEATSCPSVP